MTVDEDVYLSQMSLDKFAAHGHIVEHRANQMFWLARLCFIWLEHNILFG